MFDLITALLAWFYSVWPSYGMAIFFLTVTAMIVVTPFTMRGTRSMMQIQLLAPELKKIQNKHRGDRQALNQATMTFYKEHGVNPLGGCLPMFVQGPIFLVLYQVVRGLTRRTTEIGTQLGFTSFQYSRAQSGGAADYAETPIQRSELTFDPDFLSTDAELYADLSVETEMVSWGVDLSRSASTAMSEGIITALPYLVMMVLVLVTGLYQQRQIQGRQTNAVMHPTQQTVMKLLPYILPVISYGIPAAVVVYFIVSSLYRIGQQAYITRSLYSGDDSLGAELARQRKSADQQSSDGSGSTQSSTTRASKSVTPGKGRPTPKRDSKAPSRRVPNRKAPNRRAAQLRRPTNKTRRSAPKRSAPKRSGRASTGVRGAGRSGKAPSRNRGRGGRVTPPGTVSRRASPNRSKSKRKRR